MTFRISQVYNMDYACTNTVYVNNEEIEGIYFINKFPFYVKHSTLYEKGIIGMNLMQRLLTSLPIEGTTNIEKFNGTIEYLPFVTMEMIPTDPSNTFSFAFTHRDIENTIRMNLKDIPLIKNFKYALKIHDHTFFFMYTGEVPEDKVICINELTNINILYVSKSQPSQNTELNKDFLIALVKGESEYETIFQKGFTTRLLTETVIENNANESVVENVTTSEITNEVAKEEKS